jgi:hypothetical protein
MKGSGSTAFGPIWTVVPPEPELSAWRGRNPTLATIEAAFEAAAAAHVGDCPA